MAHLGTWKRLIKRFAVPFLALVTCVSAVSACLVCSSGGALAVNATAPTVNKDCIGITFVDEVRNWSDDDNPPYIFIYSVSSWASDSPYSTLSGAGAFDGISYDSSANALRINATWYGYKSGEGTDRIYTLQIPWFIQNCGYRWKRPQYAGNYTDEKTASAGNTYVDYLTKWNGVIGELTHETNPVADNHSSSTWSGSGTTVTEYAVIEGVYDGEKVLTTADVIQNSVYTVSENSNIGTTMDYGGVTYKLTGYYTNSTLTSGTVTSVNVGSNETLSLYAAFETPPVYFLNGNPSGWGTITNYPKMTTDDGGLTYTYLWTVDSTDNQDNAFKICNAIPSPSSWCQDAATGSTDRIVKGDDTNFYALDTGVYKVVYAVSTNKFMAYKKTGTLTLRYAVGGVLNVIDPETYNNYSPSHNDLPSTVDLADVGYNDTDYVFQGFYRGFDPVFGGVTPCATSEAFDDGATVYAVIEVRADVYSAGVYLVDADTTWSDGLPTSGKMYYKSGSGKTNTGEDGSDIDHPYSYYLTMDFETGEEFYFVDAEHFSGQSRIIVQLLSDRPSRIGDKFEIADLAESVSIGGYSQSKAYRCLVAGRYTVYYGTYTTGNPRNTRYKGFDKFDAVTPSYIYFVKHTATWSNVYCYMYNSGSKSPAGGCVDWPGVRVGDNTHAMKVTVTSLVKAKSYDSERMNDIYRIEYYPAIGAPNRVIFNNGKSDGTEAIGTDKTDNMQLVSGSSYYFKAGKTGGEKIDFLGITYAWLYDFEAALGDATIGNDDFADSVCAIVNNPTLASSFYTRYTAMANNARGYVNSATLNTYDPEDPSPESTSAVSFSTIVAYLAEVVASGSGLRYAGPGNDASPLTLTLWIVLGAGLTGMGAISAAYVISKKKKKYVA